MGGTSVASLAGVSPCSWAPSHPGCPYELQTLVWGMGTDSERPSLMDGRGLKEL